MCRLLPLLFLSLIWVLGSAASAEAKRVALVIGNSKYQFVTPLINPANDATLIAASLGKAGFEVTPLKDLDQKDMKIALVVFGRKLKQGAEAALTYYAGHGVEVNGRNFLIPVDSNTQSEEEADIHSVDLNDILALMQNSGVTFNILVLDACRNNPFRGFRSQGGGLASVDAPVGSYVAYSTGQGKVASDGDGINSPFSAALAANDAEALKLYEVASALDYAEATQRIGFSFRHGQLGLPQDPAKAMVLFEQAYAQGSIWAAQSLGYAHKEGLGSVPADAAKSYSYFKQAVVWGDSLSLFETAAAQSFGAGTEVNLKAARDDFLSAVAKVNEQDFAEILKYMKEDISPDAAKLIQTVKRF
jgi:TPR repeat protein